LALPLLDGLDQLQLDAFQAWLAAEREEALQLRQQRPGRMSRCAPRFCPRICRSVHDDRPRGEGRLALPKRRSDRPRLWFTLAAPRRRLLTYIEEQGLIVCQLDGVGRRTVTLVELAWATAPGDPGAAEAEQGVLAV
jgi:hypothetical protein